MRGRVSEAGAAQELHYARRLGTQGRDPVHRSSGFWFGQALHRSAQEANRANADSGGESRSQGLAAGDAPGANTRGTDLFLTRCKAHVAIQSEPPAHGISRM